MQSAMILQLRMLQGFLNEVNRKIIVENPEIRKIAEEMFENGFIINNGDNIAIAVNRVFKFDQGYVDTHSQKGLYFALTELELDRALLLISELKPSSRVIERSFDIILVNALPARNYEIIERAFAENLLSDESKRKILENEIETLGGKKDFEGVVILIALSQGQKIDDNYLRILKHRITSLLCLVTW